MPTGVVSHMFLSDPTFDVVIRGLVLTALAMCWVVILVRINGLRSFSKMTNFDFVMTVAVGSLLAGASQATKWLDFLQVLTGMMALFIVQYLTAPSARSVGSIRGAGAEQADHSHA